MSEPPEHGAGWSGPPPPLGLLSSALPDAPAVAVCEAARREGLDGVEWALGPGEVLSGSGGGRAADVIRLAASDHALAVCGLAAQQPDLLCAGGAGVRDALDLAAALGAPHLRVFAPPYTGGRFDVELDALRGGLRSAARQAGDLGVRLLVELSPGTLLPGPAWFLRLADGLDEADVGVVYDPGSMQMEGHVRPALALAALGGLVRHVHVKDVAPSHGSDGWRWSHVPLGQGMVRWAEVVAGLDRAAYPGWWVVDHLGGTPTAAQLHDDVTALRELLTSRPVPSANGASAASDGPDHYPVTSPPTEEALP